MSLDLNLYRYARVAVVDCYNERNKRNFDAKIYILVQGFGNAKMTKLKIRFLDPFPAFVPRAPLTLSGVRVEHCMACFKFAVVRFR